MNRSIGLDFLKGIAIIAVVLYHFELLPLGYLGVDVFLVISGFLVTRGLIKGFADQNFNYFQFVTKQLTRFLPLIALASVVSLVLGYFVMLPDDLENLSQSIVASNLFANNILSCITTNYWDISTTYKPLMHLWYLGVVLQFYLLYPFLFWLCYKTPIGQSRLFAILLTLVLFSLGLYLCPFFSSTVKFYYLPFRFFELGLGGLLALLVAKKQTTPPLKICTTSILILSLILYVVGGELSDILIVNVITIGFILASLGLQDKEERTNRVVLGIALLGQASYSIYIWHQVIYAFYKYGVESQVEGVDYLFITLLVVVVSSLSYRFLEREMGKFRKRSAKMVLGVATLLSVGVIGLSLWLYTHAGVVRDIPELGVERNNAHRGMFAEYCDRVYRMQTPFADNGKPKLLIIGNSYGRDMMNVILESSYKDSLDLSYIYPPKQLRDSEISRIQQADVICVLASYRFKEGYADLMQGIYEYTTTNHIYGIGTKEFGETNGNEYQKRHSEEYFTLTAPMDSDYVQEYKMERNCWPEAYYIDFVKPVHMANYRVRIFTDNQKFISQDCRHLTQEGARFYARELDLAKLVQFK